MPKHGWLTPKAIANRIKAKGLQKLRWYCQMCQKQCRDENGFKCHMMSESHQRQLLLVAESPGKYIHAFSDEFLHGFMELLRLQYGTRRVHCNEVYQEYIKDKNHFHMNATRWETLTGFAKWLGREGLCEVELTPKGWFIRYIDRSPEALARQEAAAKKQKMEKDDDERSQKAIERQIARALASKEEKEDDLRVFTELQRESEEEKVTFSLSKGPATAGSSSQNEEGGSTERDQPCSSEPNPGDTGGEATGFSRKKGPPATIQGLPNALKSASVATSESVRKEERGGGRKRGREEDKRGGGSGGKKRKLTALEEIRLMEEKRKERVNRRDDWVCEGIVVKVVHGGLGEKYHGRKGVVEEVRERFVAIVRMIETEDRIKIDQTHLETVIPAIGKPVMVVNGGYRGLRAVLESLDVNNFCVSIRIDQGPARGRLIERVPYEDISKLA